MRAAVVGAGIAGIACARQLVAAGHQVDVLDRGGTAGGRLATHELDGRPVDIGASYFTVSDPQFRSVVDDWIARGLAHRWTDTFGTLDEGGLGAGKQGPMRYGTRAGLRSLVQDLAGTLTVRQGVVVGAVGPGSTVDGRPYDAVVLAMPDPQALRLLDPSHRAAREQLADRTWEPVLALAAGFPERSWDFAGCFVNNDPVLSWVADDGSRRADGAPVLVAHSTPAFAARHLADPQAAGSELIGRLRELLQLDPPRWQRLQRWTYAKPVGTRDDAYGLIDGIGLCGDGWGAAKVQSAWLSGHLLGQALAAQALPT